MMKEPPIRIEEVLNGKYRFVEGQPVRRSYVDMETMKESKTIEFSDRVVEYMKNQLKETLLELENLDVEITSKCPSTFYCAKRNIIEILEILECD